MFSAVLAADFTIEPTALVDVLDVGDVLTCELAGLQISPAGQDVVAAGVAGVQTSPAGHGVVATGVAGVQISPAGQVDAIALVAKKIKEHAIIDNAERYLMDDSCWLKGGMFKCEAQQR